MLSCARKRRQVSVGSEAEAVVSWGEQSGKAEATKAQKPNSGEWEGDSQGGGGAWGRVEGSLVTAAKEGTKPDMQEAKGKWSIRLQEVGTLFDLLVTSHERIWGLSWVAGRPWFVMEEAYNMGPLFENVMKIFQMHFLRNQSLVVVLLGVNFLPDICSGQKNSMWELIRSLGTRS